MKIDYLPFCSLHFHFLLRFLMASATTLFAFAAAATAASLTATAVTAATGGAVLLGSTASTGGTTDALHTVFLRLHDISYRTAYNGHKYKN